MPKKVLIGIPTTLLAQVDYVAGAEHRTRSDLMREALRRYVASFRLPDVAACVHLDSEAPAPTERQQLEQAYALPSKKTT